MTVTTTTSKVSSFFDEVINFTNLFLALYLRIFQAIRYAGFLVFRTSLGSERVTTTKPPE